MVAANKYLLREVRRLAIKDELLAMRLRGRLVVPLLAIQPAKKKPTGTGRPTGFFAQASRCQLATQANFFWLSVLAVHIVLLEPLPPSQPRRPLSCLPPRRS